MIPSTSRAVILDAPRTLRLVDLPIPQSLPDDHALLRVEANGLCGTDWERFTGANPVGFSHVPGHEPVGTLAWVGDRFPARREFPEGSRVVVEAFVACHHCAECRLGRTRLCLNGFTYGKNPVTLDHGLWGGFAEYTVIKPSAVMHAIPDGVSTAEAALVNALGAGFGWTEEADIRPGDTVLVLGPGQRGLACAIAALERGAGRVVMTGLPSDAFKLDLAHELGVAHTIEVDESTDVAGELLAVTGGLADRTIDVTSSPRTTVDALRATRRGGTVVLAGVKGARSPSDFRSDDIVLNRLTVKGVISAGSWGQDQALRLLETGQLPLDHLAPRAVPLDEAERGLLLLGNEAGSPVMSVAIHP